jgi:hypothetical protein
VIEALIDDGNKLIKAGKSLSIEVETTEVRFDYPMKVSFVQRLLAVCAREDQGNQEEEEEEEEDVEEEKDRKKEEEDEEDEEEDEEDEDDDEDDEEEENEDDEEDHEDDEEDDNDDKDDDDDNDDYDDGDSDDENEVDEAGHGGFDEKFADEFTLHEMKMKKMKIIPVSSKEEPPSGCHRYFRITHFGNKTEGELSDKHDEKARELGAHTQSLCQKPGWLQKLEQRKTRGLNRPSQNFKQRRAQSTELPHGSWPVTLLENSLARTSI